MSQTDRSEARIVIAENDEDVLYSYELWLSKIDGWNVITATNGADALDLLYEGVDVLITDRQMSRLDAEAIVKHLDESGYDVVHIVVSAYSPDSYLHEDDVDAYLNKPVSKLELIDIVGRTLQGPRPQPSSKM